MKESKRSYITNYFQNNLNELKSTWKSITNLISLKELPNVAPWIIFDNGRSLMNHERERERERESQCFLTNILLTLLLTFNLLLDTLKIVFMIFSPP